MRIAIAGGGAFGTALAIALSRVGPVTLWARDGAMIDAARASRRMPRLPDIDLPETIALTSATEALREADIVLLAIPAQSLRHFLQDPGPVLAGKPLVACGKGIDLETLTGPTATITAMLPDASPAVLTGPSFAADIARGLPTALTLACRDDGLGRQLQGALSTPSLRLYRTTDTIGAELGGALKNVIAIACGACIGAALGDSARAALMTRGFAEMRRLAAHLGADPETLAGLSGLGDLALTCASPISRNFAYGMALGEGRAFDPAVTVEGAATSLAVTSLATRLDLAMPVSTVTAALVSGRLTVRDAMTELLNRPLKEE